MIEGAREIAEQSRQATIKELDRQISNLRWRQGRNLRDGIECQASKMSQEIEALVRKRNELLGSGEHSGQRWASDSFSGGTYEDLDLLDPPHAEEHRKEILRLYRTHHGLPAFERLVERGIADVRHEKERMREEVEWVKGE